MDFEARRFVLSGPPRRAKGRRAAAGEKKKAGGAKAVLAEKIREVERLWRQGDQSNWEDEKLFNDAERATAEVLAAAVQTNLEAGAEARYVEPCAVVVTRPDGGAKAFVWAPQLPMYAGAGFPLPEDAEQKDAGLVVVGLEVGADFTHLARHLGRALACFSWVTLTGVEPSTGRYGAADARENLRRLARGIAEHKSPANLVREASKSTGEPLDLDLLRDLRGFWEDFCEGRVAL